MESPRIVKTQQLDQKNNNDSSNSSTSKVIIIREAQVKLSALPMLIFFNDVLLGVLAPGGVLTKTTEKINNTIYGIHGESKSCMIWDDKCLDDQSGVLNTKNSTPDTNTVTFNLNSNEITYFLVTMNLFSKSEINIISKKQAMKRVNFSSPKLEIKTKERRHQFKNFGGYGEDGVSVGLSLLFERDDWIIGLEWERMTGLFSGDHDFIAPTAGRSWKVGPNLEFQLLGTVGGHQNPSSDWATFGGIRAALNYIFPRRDIFIGITGTVRSNIYGSTENTNIDRKSHNSGGIQSGITF